MEGTMTITDGVDRVMHRPSSVSNDVLNRAVEQLELPAPSKVPDAIRLIKIHQRIIADVSVLQQRWIKQQSRKMSIGMTKDVQKLEPLSTGIVLQQKQKQGLLLRLHQLRKHRMAVSAKIESVKRSKSTTQSSLQKQLQPARQLNQQGNQSVVESADRSTTFSRKEEGQVRQQQQQKQYSIQSLLYDSDDQRNIWNQIHSLRQMKCIPAAYRLMGTSVIVPNNNNNSTNEDDNERLIIRFDIGNSNSYECTFDVAHFATVPNTTLGDEIKKHVESDKSEQLFLRLTHHNLPSVIPITNIFQKAMNRFGNSVSISNAKFNWFNDSTVTMMMIPLGHAVSSKLLEESSTGAFNGNEQVHFMKQLQFVTQQIYHTCHGFHVRKDIYEFLKQQQASDDTNSMRVRDSVPYSIQKLQCTIVRQQPEIYNTLQFHIIHQLSSIDHIQVTLHYTTDLCRLKSYLPTSVIVKIVSPMSNRYLDDDIINNNKNNNKQSSLSSLLLYNQKGTVSDVEEERNDDYDEDDDTSNHYEFIESSIRSFRTLPVQSAIQTVTDAMAEY